MAQKGVRARATKLEKDIEKRVHPTPDEAAAHEAKALATLVALLDSDDERIRLEAAQAILNRQHVAQAESKVAGAVKKVAKKVL